MANRTFRYCNALKEVLLLFLVAFVSSYYYAFCNNYTLFVHVTKVMCNYVIVKDTDRVFDNGPTLILFSQTTL